MATHSIHPESDQGNDDLLIHIAKVYLQLEALHVKGRHLWPEDEDALMLCMDRLQNAALTIEIKTPEDCLALGTIFTAKQDLDPDDLGPFQQVECKVFEFARKLVQER